MDTDIHRVVTNVKRSVRRRDLDTLRCIFLASARKIERYADSRAGDLLRLVHVISGMEIDLRLGRTEPVIPPHLLEGKDEP